MFKDESGRAAEAQLTAFDDTWHWGETAEAMYRELVQEGPAHVGTLMDSLCQVLKRSQMMAYLVMMAPRLVELHRVLKPTGSLYLHCDSVASHYLKIVLDAIFGPENFRNEIIWKRTNARSTTDRWPRVHDTLLFYTKSDDFVFQAISVKADKAKLPHTLITGPDGQKHQTYELTGPGLTREGDSGKPWRGFNPSSMGRHWADSLEKREQWDAEGLIHWPKPGTAGGFPRRRASEPFDADDRQITVPDIWTDIDRINQSAKERLGYPTQKPVALLERIVQASSNPGDLVLDPFCGCGTTVAAAQKLNRRWIGIDITHLAIALQKYRLADMFPGVEYQVVGEPEDLGAARQLAHDDRYQFQWWALSLIKARPLGEQQGTKAGKKGADRGVDGLINFIDEASGKAKRVLVQVKSGHVTAAVVRDLRGTVEREGAEIGVLVTLELPTGEMEKEAVSAGYYHSPGYNRNYRRIQILTIDELLHGHQVDMPHEVGTFKQAPKAASGAVQGQLEL